MGNTIKRFMRHHWLVIVLFVVFMTGGVLLLGQRQHTNPSASVPPTQVIMKQATVVGQGVQVEWLESQAGTHPVAGYVVERSRNGTGFERIARVEGIFLKYLDAEGRDGDSYRIVAEDSRRPARQSQASEHTVAAAAKPGSNVIVAAGQSRVLGASSTAIGQAETPEETADVLRNLITRTFTDFDTALADNSTDTARGYLDALQHYQRQALSLWPQLSPAHKVRLAQACAEQMDVFEANLHVLAEDAQMDGMLVLAGCNAIQGGTE